MNMVEALKAAQERGFSTIAKPYGRGLFLMRVTNERGRTEAAEFPAGVGLSRVIHNYSPNLSETLSDEWYVPEGLYYGNAHPPDFEENVLLIDECEPDVNVCTDDIKVIKFAENLADVPVADENNSLQKFNPILINKNIPHTSSIFKNAVKNATYSELAYAESYLFQMNSCGEPVKMRLKAVNKEMVLRRAEEI